MSAEADEITHHGVSGAEALDVLCQIGWFDDNRRFMSLRLTDKQFGVLAAAQHLFGAKPIEEIIADCVLRCLEEMNDAQPIRP